MSTVAATQQCHCPGRRRVRIARVAWVESVVCAALLVVTLLSGLSAQDAGAAHAARTDVFEADAMTDEQALAQLLREAAQDAAAAAVPCDPGSVLLRVIPEDSPTALMQVFAEELMARGLNVRTTAEGAHCRLTVEARGMFSSAVSAGNSSYFRKIDLTLGILLEDASGNVAYSRERQLTRADTLRGEAPYDRRSFLDAAPSWRETWLEPVLVTATAIVIAVLLFTVRGSS